MVFLLLPLAIMAQAYDPGGLTGVCTAVQEGAIFRTSHDLASDITVSGLTTGIE